MRSRTLKKIVSAILAIVVAAAESTAVLAQTNVVPIGLEEIEIQVRQQWKDSQATCEKLAQTKIDHVDIIDSNEFKSWLVIQHVVPDDGTKVLPEGNYVRVASSAERLGDGITAYGPVNSALQSTDFGNIVGLEICNYKLLRKYGT